jgi:predicted KAP-like P-loop ATPase
MKQKEQELVNERKRNQESFSQLQEQLDAANQKIQERNDKLVNRETELK